MRQIELLNQQMVQIANPTPTKLPPSPPVAPFTVREHVNVVLAEPLSLTDKRDRFLDGTCSIRDKVFFLKTSKTGSTSGLVSVFIQSYLNHQVQSPTF